MAAEARPLEVAAEALAAVRSDGVAHAVLDVREAWELDICKLAGSLHIPLGELEARLNEVPNDRPVFVICHTGGRSLLATGGLRRAGLPLATNVKGGVEAWSLHIDPSLQRY